MVPADITDRTDQVPADITDWTRGQFEGSLAKLRISVRGFVFYRQHPSRWPQLAPGAAHHQHHETLCRRRQSPQEGMLPLG